MATLAETLAADMLELEADRKTTWTFGTQTTLVGLNGTLRKGQRVEFATIEDETDRILIARTNQMTSRPVANSTIAISGTNYRVLAVATDPLDVNVALALKEYDA